MAKPIQYCKVKIIIMIIIIKLKKKILRGFNSTLTENFQMLELDLEKVEEQEIKLPTSVGPWKI